MIQRALPFGLSVDTYGGIAWVGIVPFFMRGVRPTLLPFLSSDFLELNLRTYVSDQKGRPGVRFYSLDANHPLAVWMARLFFGLRYMHAKLQVESRDGEFGYSCQRRGSATGQMESFTDSALSVGMVPETKVLCFSKQRVRDLSGLIIHDDK
jgi:hypothetical protein